MIAAALSGKIPSSLIHSEDVLTSNVFSFFKYSERTIYLKSLLRLLGIFPSNEELKTAEIRFWPRYDDCTEPDIVIIVGNYYILVEAKHFSDFGTESNTRKGQVDREIRGGVNESRILEKEFLFVAITSHYNEPKFKLNQYRSVNAAKIKWMNWQAIATLLLNLLEETAEIPDRSFAEDLYNLLEKMNLRRFLSFNRINVQISDPPEHIFFSAKSSQFRGDFIGFEKALGNEKHIDAQKKFLFFQHQYFTSNLLNLNFTAEFSLGGKH